LGVTPGRLDTQHLHTKEEDRMTQAAKPNLIPDSYRRVPPSFTVQGGVKALEFYGAVFGATERMRFPGPDGSIAHAEIQIGTQLS
jgi:PhnB protein